MAENLEILDTAVSLLVRAKPRGFRARSRVCLPFPPLAVLLCLRSRRTPLSDIPSCFQDFCSAGKTTPGAAVEPSSRPNAPASLGCGTIAPTRWPRSPAHSTHALLPPTPSPFSLNLRPLLLCHDPKDRCSAGKATHGAAAESVLPASATTPDTHHRRTPSSRDSCRRPSCIPESVNSPNRPRTSAVSRTRCLDSYNYLEDIGFDPDL
jgi:hypothetical protein